MEEIWKTISGYEGFYEVSNYGSVKRLEHKDKVGHTYKERILKPYKNNLGYCHVHLSKQGKAKWFLVHRLVAEAFLEKPSDCNIVNHLDNNPSNNNASNLEWTTYKGNMQWAAKQGRMKGCPANLDKAREAHKIPVVAIKDGYRIEFESGVEAGKILGVRSGHIAKACRKEYGYKTVGGYEWEYADKTLQAKQKPNKVRMPENEYIEKLKARMIGNKYSQGISPSAETRKKISIAVSIPVLQYDKNGVFIARYYGTEEARRNTGIKHIDACARGERKTAGGYIWKYERKVKNE